ncbi:dual specificity phosphatase [Suillus placidus]|uniref:protein-tyrosine-phosphatase n=1 Tax=Suillus placidus TaxID=48579 RepID=A0A9P7D2I1_9AGAM|nr:dual specificity phosphatase [Suillus placidus]
MPSLILKRSKRTLPTFASLRQFITSDEGKEVFDSWDINGDVVIVHGEETDERESNNPGVIPWALLSVLAGFLNPDKALNFMHDSESTSSMRSILPHLLSKPLCNCQNHQRAQRDGLSFNLTPTTLLDQGHGGEVERPGHSPLPIIHGLSLTLDSPIDSDPPPSKLAFRRAPPPRRPNNLNVDRVKANGTSDAANDNAMSGQTLAKPIKHAVTTLPWLQIHTAPTRSSTLPITSSQQTVPPASAFNSSFNFNLTNGSCLWNTTSSPPVPMTPSTARPTPTTSTPGGTSSDTENEREEFIISTILPNFLFLGPELISPSHKRIINIAAECTNDRGLMLRERFERYVHIPMRDCVEEKGVRKGLSKACDVLDEAALYNAPTYVHCKAGKSRSVTAVMAYLIHSHHWPLARAYRFVLDRRKGISPNIGFVSELMAFEEAELGRMTKPKPSAAASESSVGDVGVGTGRRPAHVRESLPPMPSWDREEEEAGEETGQDMEIRDREGRYRHVRRAPVDENTLQPMRRVSKAGLESAGSIYGDDWDET